MRHISPILALIAHSKHSCVGPGRTLSGKMKKKLPWEKEENKAQMAGNTFVPNSQTAAGSDPTHSSNTADAGGIHPAVKRAMSIAGEKVPVGSEKGGELVVMGEHQSIVRKQLPSQHPQPPQPAQPLIGDGIVGRSVTGAQQSAAVTNLSQARRPAGFLAPSNASNVPANALRGFGGLTQTAQFLGREHVPEPENAATAATADVKQKLWLNAEKLPVRGVQLKARDMQSNDADGSRATKARVQQGNVSQPLGNGGQSQKGNGGQFQKGNGGQSKKGNVSGQPGSKSKSLNSPEKTIDLQEIENENASAFEESDVPDGILLQKDNLQPLQLIANFEGDDSEVRFQFSIIT